MKLCELIIIFVLSIIIIIIKDGFKIHNFSKIIKSNEIEEIINLNILLDSFYNSLLYYFLNKYNDIENYSIFLDKVVSLISYICKIIIFVTKFTCKYFYCFFAFIIPERLKIFCRKCLCCRCNKYYTKCNDFLYDLFSILGILLNYFGRIVYSILSLETLFFFFNMVIQSFLLFIGLLIDMQNKVFYIIFSILYILVIIFSLDILIIPTYEFITFPFLFYTNPNLHLNSFKKIFMIKKGEKKNKNIEDNLVKENNDKINGTLTIFGLFYIIFF